MAEDEPSDKIFLYYPLIQKENSDLNISEKSLEQIKSLIEELEENQRKIHKREENEKYFFVFSSHPHGPTSQSIFLTYEEAVNMHRNGKLIGIEYDVTYCNEILEKIKQIYQTLLENEKEDYSDKITLLEKKFDEFKKSVNMFIRAMENLKGCKYHASFSLKEFNEFYEKLGTAKDICYGNDKNCKRSIIDFLDKSLEILYSIK